MPPIGPSPSIEGTPMPDVVFASDAPPVETSFVSKPAAWRSRSRDPRGGPSGPASPSAPSRTACRRRPRRPARRLGRQVVDRGQRGGRRSPAIARTSTSSSAWSRTMFGRVPALNTPTLVVTAGQRPLSAWMPWTIAAPARIALRPFSGSTPACAARPLTVELDVGDAFPRRDEVAVCPRALEHEARVRCRRELLDVRRR